MKRDQTKPITAETECNAGINRVAIARAAIVTAGRAGQTAGIIACPVCMTGQLRYRIAQCNGHIHAGCSTFGCVAWME